MVVTVDGRMYSAHPPTTPDTKVRWFREANAQYDLIPAEESVISQLSQVLRRMGRTAAAVLVALVGVLFLGSPAAAQITDTDVINFAINLECLEVRTASLTEQLTYSAARIRQQSDRR